MDVRGASGSASGRVNLFVSRGPTIVGDRGVGVLSALGGGRATITGDIVLGRTPRGDGRMQVRQTGSRVEYGGTLGAPARFLIGNEGVGELVVGLENDPAPGPQIVQIQPVQEVVVGNEAGSIGRVTIAGTGSRWITTAGRTVFGERGHAEVSVRAGGTFESNSPNEVRIANLQGSFGMLEVRGPGSMATVASSLAIGLGGQGVVTVSPGATLSAAGGINVLPRGRLVGAGTVSGTLVNTGEVRVGVPPAGESMPTGFGVLQVQGDYRQLGPSVVGQQQSGSLVVRLGGTERGVDYDAVDVTQDAFLGGGLFVTLTEPYMQVGGPKVGDVFEILEGAQLDPSSRTFDVALLPGFPDDRLLRVNYASGRVQIEATTFGRAFGFEPPTDGATVAGESARAIVTDLDRDGRPDLAVIASQGGVGALFVFRNAGVDPVTGAWLGFESLLTLSLAGEGTPRALATGDFFRENGFSDDLVIAFDREGEGRIRFYRNTGGNPLFLPAEFYTIADDPVALAVGDISGNFLDDVVAVTGETRTIERLFSSAAMAPMQQMPRPLTAPVRPSSVDVGDLDNDKDVVLGGALRHRDRRRGGNAILVLRNTGSEASRTIRSSSASEALSSRSSRGRESGRLDRHPGSCARGG